MQLLMAALLTVNLQLVVRVYDSAGARPVDVERARASVGAILTSVGIDPIWRPCHVSTCTGPVKPHEVVVRLVTSRPGSATGSLGFSLIDVSQHAGSLGTIYIDRVHALATQSGVEEGDLLGRAIAHEIGHLLIGTSGHARSGLMRAVWVTSELRRGQPSDWVFSRREGAELRRHLEERIWPRTLMARANDVAQDPGSEVCDH